MQSVLSQRIRRCHWLSLHHLHNAGMLANSEATGVADVVADELEMSTLEDRGLSKLG